MVRLLAALVLGASCASTPWGQGAADADPERLRVHLRSETFTPIASVAALPDPVKAALARLFGTKTLELAERGAPFQATDLIVTPRLPWRRLVAAGCAADHCLVHYERGGFARAYLAVVLSRQGDEARFVRGAQLASPIADVHGVRDALAAGQVLEPTSGW